MTFTKGDKVKFKDGYSHHSIKTDDTLTVSGTLDRVVSIKVNDNPPTGGWLVECFELDLPNNKYMELFL